MSVSNTTREYLLSQWFPVIKACHDSGLNVRTWCEKNDINEKQFYYWQRKLRAKVSETLPIESNSRFVQLPTTTVKPIMNHSSDFIPSMVIRMGSASIELSDHVQPDLLVSVLKVLSDV